MKCCVTTSRLPSIVSIEKRIVSRRYGVDWLGFAVFCRKYNPGKLCKFVTFPLISKHLLEAAETTQSTKVRLCPSTQQDDDGRDTTKQQPAARNSLSTS